MNRPWLVLVLLLPACSELLDPFPRAAIRVDPLPVYAEWWRMTEACSGRERPMSRIEWFVIPGVDAFDSGRLKGISGLYSGDRIVLAETSIRSGPLVRHEMLHALLREGSHTRGYFIGLCGGVVNCILDCLEEESPPPPTTAAVATKSDSLEVSIAIWPDKPGSVLGGYVRLAVSAHNPKTVPVVVQLPPLFDFGLPRSFGWELRSTVFERASDEQVRAPEVTRFGPQETKTMYFDFWLNADSYFVREVPAGLVEFRGRYGEKWSAPRSVTIAP